MGNRIRHLVWGQLIVGFGMVPGASGNTGLRFCAEALLHRDSSPMNVNLLSHAGEYARCRKRGEVLVIYGFVLHLGHPIV